MGVTHRGQGVVTEGLGLLQKLRLWEGLRGLGERIWVRRGRGRDLGPSPTPPGVSPPPHLAQDQQEGVACRAGAGPGLARAVLGKRGRG